MRGAIGKVGAGAVVLVLAVFAGFQAPAHPPPGYALASAEKCGRCHDRAVVVRAAQRLAQDTSDCAACHAEPAPRARQAGLLTAPLAHAASAPSGAKSRARDDLVLIPAGSFWMGSDDRHPDEAPRRRVTLSAFFMDRYEVTNADYRAHLDAIGGGPVNEIWIEGRFPAEAAEYPVANVTWHEAKAYCAWRGARLPTEAEWEKAARGTDGRTFPWGDGMNPKLANIAESHVGHTLPVGSFPDGRSPYGLYDMAGNVWEWAEDWYQAYPGNREPDDNYGERYKVARGGGYKVCTFYGCGSNAPTFNRAFFSPESRNETFGFRCARSANRP